MKVFELVHGLLIIDLDYNNVTLSSKNVLLKVWILLYIINQICLDNRELRM